MYITSLCEECVLRRIRHFYKVPTQSMLCDPLTKIMTTVQLTTMLSSGWLSMKNEEKQKLKVRHAVTHAYDDDNDENYNPNDYDAT